MHRPMGTKGEGDEAPTAIRAQKARVTRRHTAICAHKAEVTAFHTAQRAQKARWPRRCALDGLRRRAAATQALIATRALIADLGTEAALGCVPVPLLAMLAHIASRRYRSWRSWGGLLLVLPAGGDQQAGRSCRTAYAGEVAAFHTAQWAQKARWRVGARWTARGGGGRQRRGR